ncbi:cell division protein FtsQ [Clostridium sp. DSM 8431]|uniref:cell division protein FtsQ/DivIB n=1 Tax=Clostridium sp. DSM 8431 TaxID=1761781 RepID=UPI0008EB6C81|nr:FtsQ-type POTRA domain-containing protein [Clostridium sp. DSM 8431]SFU28448.1 cell division protein FtsQ [Clostridium sp. DSM 8431]
MANTNNVYIRKARKNRKIKRIILLCIFLIFSGIIVITYTDIFKIKDVEITSENLLVKDYVEEKAESLKGLNLVFLTDKKLNSIFADNYYISEVKMKKIYPSSINISVTEKTGLFYQKDGSMYNILSSGMIYIENTSTIKSDNMIEIVGVDFLGRGIGEDISTSTREKEFLNNIYNAQEFLNENFDDVKITKVDISNLSDIKCYFNNVEVYLGNDEDTIKKIKTAALIYDQCGVKNYIKVNFTGSPDFE